MIDEEERRKAITVVSELTQEEEFWTYLAHPDGFIRGFTIEHLSAVATEKSISYLSLLLNDNFDFVVKEATELLQKIGTEWCIEILYRALRSSQIERPTFFANALAHLGAPGFDALMDCLKSKNPSVRYYAARGLGSSKNIAAKQVLEGLIESDHEKTSFGGMVSTAAKKGLKILMREKNA